MKSLFTWIALVLSIQVLLVSCQKIEGVGPIVSEIRNKTGYQGLQISICGQTTYTIAPQYSLELRAQRNILDEIVTKVENDALIIKWDKPLKVVNCEDVTVNISGPDLKFLHSSGANDIRVKGNVKQTDLELTISGSGNMNFDQIEVTHHISAHISGSGNIIINSGGAVQESDLFLSGSGNLDFGRMPMDHNTSTISGSGSIKVNVLKSLKAIISGSGDVYYYGNPHVESRISGSGRVKQL